MEFYHSTLHKVTLLDPYEMDNLESIPGQQDYSEEKRNQLHSDAVKVYPKEATKPQDNLDSITAMLEPLLALCMAF